jgi:EAL domain-containing protein (putative c-di-GMP-specific phosphodiesterase class I)
MRDLDQARNLGIDFVQGFLFSRPVSAEMILESGLLYPKPQARTL